MKPASDLGLLDLLMAELGQVSGPFKQARSSSPPNLTLGQLYKEGTMAEGLNGDQVVS